MRKIALFLIAILCVASTASATTTVTGTIQTLGTTTIGSNAFVRFWLRGCAGNQPRVNGTSIIGPTAGGVFYFDFAANASGVISGTLYSTRDSTGNNGGDIECGGSKTAVWYGMQVWVAGKSGPEVPIVAKNTATIDVSNVTPISTNPVIVAPTGDSTYARLDAGNQPFTGAVQAPGATITGALTTTAGGTLGGVFSVTGNDSLSGNNTLSGNNAFSGNNTHSGTETFKTLNAGVILFADQFSGSDASAKIAAAITALPSAGGVIDARALTDVGGTGSTAIDPGTKAVTLLLGPTTYNFSQVTLRRAFHMIGAGGFPANATIIQATGGNTTPPFVIDQVTAAQGVLLQGFAVQGTAANTSQDCFHLLGGSTGGLWYSKFDDIIVNGFSGIGLNLDTQTTTGAIHQFSTFDRVIVFRTSNGGAALQIKGWANSLKFNNCEFDGIFNTNNTGSNIVITGTGVTFPPYDIQFDLVTCQYSNICMSVNGADTVSVKAGHIEAVQQVFALGTSAGFGTLNFVVSDTSFGNNSGIGVASPGVGVGNGYIMDNLAATANVSAVLVNSHSYNTPDAFLKGNTGAIFSCANTIGPEGSYAYQPCQLNTPNGFGNGASGTAVTTTLKGTGTGPATPQTVVAYIQVTLSGTTYWLPLMQ